MTRGILISGPTIAFDDELGRALEENAEIFKNSNNAEIESIIATHKIDLVLLEISKDRDWEVEIIKRVKKRFPGVLVVLIDGDNKRNVIAQAFESGVKDAFRKPYKTELVVERVNVLIKKLNRNFLNQMIL